VKRSVLCVALLPVLFAVPAAVSQPFDGYATFTRNGGMYFQASSTSAGQPVDQGTWEFWVKLTAPLQSGDFPSFVGKGYTTSYWIGGAYIAGGEAVLRSYTHGTSSVYDAGTIPVGVWTHVAVTTDGTTRRHYINGTLVGSTADSGPPTPSTNALRIGSDANWNFQPAAQLDEVRIWTVARTQNQIRSTMAAPLTPPATALLAAYHLDGSGADATGLASAAGVGATAFGTTNTGTRTFFVPVVLKNQYSSEITFTNRGTTTATVSMQYTATSGGGSGTATSFTLAPGRQRVEADAIDFLSLQGLPIDATGTRLGTLRVAFTGLSANDAAAVTVRTATDTTNPVGRAGLSYAGVPVEKTFASTVYLPSLAFSTSGVRTNLALQNAGAAADGNVTLRVTIYNPTGGTFGILPDVTLAPGGFRQFSSADMGLYENYSGGAKVETVGGTARFYAYAVQNDQINSDGSFILPVDPANATRSTVTIPSVVEAGAFRTELTIYNTGDLTRNVVASLLCPSCPTPAGIGFAVPAKGVVYFQDFIATCRASAFGGSLANPLGVAVVTLNELDASMNVQDLVAVARTSSTVPGQGKFGVAYPALRAAQGAPYVTWISAAQQNATNRTNLAVVNLGDLDSGAISVHVDVYDGTTGTLAASVDDPRLAGIPAGGFVQINAFLSAFAPGITNAYVRITRTSGVNAYAAYGVVNDGGNPGERTGDGAYTAMDVPYR
jgi:Concanavalin A-like lectin/glucanases superfamily